MAGPLDIRFVASYPDVAEMPPTEAELAIAGRSNVGKSSLINALAHRRDLAKTSKTPGATRLLNAFEVGAENSNCWLVDLPGYGYAKRSKAEQERWGEMIERYLLDRPQLIGVLLLIDGEVGPTSLDLQTRDWMAEVGLAVQFVATKADKVRPSKSKRRRLDLVDKLGVDKADVMWVSAAKGNGIPQLRGVIAGHLGVS